MANKLTQGLNLKQEIKLSPIQQQLIKLMIYPQAELIQKLEEETIENPMLELEIIDHKEDKTNQEDDFQNTEKEAKQENNSQQDENTSTTNSEDEKEETNQENDLQYDEEDPLQKYEEIEKFHYSRSEGVYLDDNNEIQIRSAQSPYEMVSKDIETMNLSKREKIIANSIIEFMDHNGLLTLPPKNTDDDKKTKIDDDKKAKEKLLSHIKAHINKKAKKTGITVTKEEILKVLKKLQNELEPAGILATSIREALLLQLKRLPASEERDIAIKILEKYPKKLENKKYNELYKILKIDEDKLKEVKEFIRKNTTFPPIKENETFTEKQYKFIVPDFILKIITKDDEKIELKAELVKHKVPVLKINSKYKEELDRLKAKKKRKKELTEKEEESLKFLEEKYKDASTLIEALKSRPIIMERIINAIVEHQREFFLNNGDKKFIKPLILEDIEKKVGLDKSSISRAVNKKYIKTPFGIIPVKELFSEAINKDANNQVSKASAKEALKEIIETEDKKSPYNDEELRKLLKERYGIEVARRTVAKYREELGFPRAGLRKEL